MLRVQVVRSLLVDTVASLAPQEPGAGARRAALEKARTRAALVVALDLAAILVLFLWRDGTEAFLVAGGSPEAIFTLGILAVAVHAGFRLGQREKYSAVLRALDALPPEQREVVVLKEFEGLKFREIAEILGCPESTVKSRMYYGLNGVRSSLAGQGITGL